MANVCSKTQFCFLDSATIMRKRKTTSSHVQEHAKKRKIIVAGQDNKALAVDWHQATVDATSQAAPSREVFLFPSPTTLSLNKWLHKWLWTIPSLRAFVRDMFWPFSSRARPRLQVSKDTSLGWYSPTHFNVAELILELCKWVHGPDSIATYDTVRYSYSDTNWCELTLHPDIRLVHLSAINTLSDEGIEHMCEHIYHAAAMSKSHVGILVSRFHWTDNKEALDLHAHANSSLPFGDCSPWSLVRTSWGMSQVVHWLLSERRRELHVDQLLASVMSVQVQRQIVLDYLQIL
jgi:hypothetical protein